MGTRKFKVGDRVIAFGEIDGNDNVIGVTGTVKHYNGRYAVEFDIPVGGHTAGGCAKDEHGWWCSGRELERYEELPDGDITIAITYEEVMML